MGLVGMHIVYQPALFGNPEWVWATYEPGVSSPEEHRCCPNLMLYEKASDLPASPVPNQVTRAGDCAVTEAEAAEACPGRAETPGAYTSADCMGCHGTYAEQNSSFIFGHRPCCVRADGFPPNVCGGLHDRTSCDANQACTWVEATRRASRSRPVD